MAAKTVKLDQAKKAVTVQGLRLEQRMVFEFFDKQPEAIRDQLAAKAMMIGVLALAEERLAAFLSRTTNTLGTELEQLKFLYELNSNVLHRTTGKGHDAEHELIEQLAEYSKGRGYRDTIEHCGDSFGDLPKNKTGDLVVIVNGEVDRRLVIESKFDKAKRLGRFEDKDVFAKGDTAVSQLLEARANRGAEHSIIVFDESAVDGKLRAEVGLARFFPHIGFVCVVDSERNNYDPLFLCYEVARGMMMGVLKEPSDHGQLALIVARFLHDIGLFLELKKRCQRLLADVSSMIDLVDRASLSLEFTKEVFGEFCRQGYLSSEQLVKFYSADDVKSRYSFVKGMAPDGDSGE